MERVFTVVILGRPGSGKTALANALIRTDRHATGRRDPRDWPLFVQKKNNAVAILETSIVDDPTAFASTRALAMADRVVLVSHLAQPPPTATHLAAASAWTTEAPRVLLTGTDGVHSTAAIAARDLARKASRAGLRPAIFADLRSEFCRYTGPRGNGSQIPGHAKSDSCWVAADLEQLVRVPTALAGTPQRMAPTSAEVWDVDHMDGFVQRVAARIRGGLAVGDRLTHLRNGRFRRPLVTMTVVSIRAATNSTSELLFPSFAELEVEQDDEVLLLTPGDTLITPGSAWARTSVRQLEVHPLPSSRLASGNASWEHVELDLGFYTLRGSIDPDSIQQLTGPAGESRRTCQFTVDGAPPLSTGPYHCLLRTFDGEIFAIGTLYE